MKILKSTYFVEHRDWPLPLVLRFALVQDPSNITLLGLKGPFLKAMKN